MGKKGYLILENGQIFEGMSFGSDKEVSGEVVFNTGMTGYPESFTDPSYYGQILTMTYPLIGNYGIPKETIKDGVTEYFESKTGQIRGLIVSSYMENDTHWQSIRTLSQWLKEKKIPALTGVDTRTLTKIIREVGVLKGIITFKKPRQTAGLNFYDINKDNMLPFVSCQKPIVYGDSSLKIAIIDCGLKYNQIRLLLKHNTTIIQIPWNFNLFGESDKSFKIDAIFISNGPGDARLAPETIRIVKEGIDRRIPILGICLGHQILALAAGADIYKLKYGHRGQNQPVRDEFTGHCFITSQNHGFAVDGKTLPKPWCPWFTNLNDGTNEGIRHPKLPFFSTQFHPEAAPGPTDTEWIINYFMSEVRLWLKKNKN